MLPRAKPQSRRQVLPTQQAEGQSEPPPTATPQPVAQPHRKSLTNRPRNRKSLTAGATPGPQALVRRQSTGAPQVHNDGVEELLDMICDTDAMRLEAEVSGYDPSNLPLEQLSRQRIAEAFVRLAAIEQELRRPKPCSTRLSCLTSELADAVPCSRHPIDTAEKIERCSSMLQLLGDIEPVYNSLLQLTAARVTRKRAADDQECNADPRVAKKLMRRAPPEGSLKRPATPFFQFYLEARVSIAKELGPGASFGADTKRAAEMWRTLTDKQKRPYIKRYRELKESYDADRLALRASMADGRLSEVLSRRRSKMLGCRVRLLPKDSWTWNIIYDYVKLSQAVESNQSVLRVSRVFAVSRHSEESRSAKAARQDRTLLWHNANVASLAGVLFQGLRSRRPGSGITFADAPKGVGVTAETCEGQCLLLLADIPASRCRGHSDKGDLWWGESVQDVSKSVALADGTRVPLETLVQNKGQQSHNTYVASNTAHVRLRFLVELFSAEPHEAAALDAVTATEGIRRPRRLRTKTAVELAPWAGAAGA